MLTGISLSSGAVITLQDGVDGYAGTADTSLFQDFSDNSSGGFPYLFAGVNRSAAARRSLLRFNLQGKMPAGAQVTSVSLHLYLEFGRNTEMTLKVHRMAKAWNEGNNPLTDLQTVGQGAPAQAGDCTWADNVFPATSWATPGGDFENAASGTGTAAIYGYWVTVHGAGMAADVQAWLDIGAVPNYGWILLGDETGFQNAMRFNSSEATDRRPRLVIEYTVNSPVDDWWVY